MDREEKPGEREEGNLKTASSCEKFPVKKMTRKDVFCNKASNNCCYFVDSPPFPCNTQSKASIYKS